MQHIESRGGGRFPRMEFDVRIFFGWTPQKDRSYYYRKSLKKKKKKKKKKCPHVKQTYKQTEQNKTNQNKTNKPFLSASCIPYQQNPISKIRKGTLTHLLQLISSIFSEFFPSTLFHGTFHFFPNDSFPPNDNQQRGSVPLAIATD